MQLAAPPLLDSLLVSGLRTSLAAVASAKCANVQLILGQRCELKQLMVAGIQVNQFADLAERKRSQMEFEWQIHERLRPSLIFHFQETYPAPLISLGGRLLILDLDGGSLESGCRGGLCWYFNVVCPTSFRICGDGVANLIHGSCHSACGRRSHHTHILFLHRSANLSSAIVKKVQMRARLERRRTN